VKAFVMFAVSLLIVFGSAISVAADSVPPLPDTAPTVTASPNTTASVLPADTVSTSDFMTQVLAAIKSFGGLSWVLKIAAIVTLILASMKVSILNTYVWSKLGNFKTWAAPLLGLIAGVLSLSQGTAGISLAALTAYVGAGSGAILLHELLDTVKAIPGIGPKWVELITVIETYLGGPAAQAVKPAA
jgi:hypothetical protein